jgi:hypothetical protein
MNHCETCQHWKQEETQDWSSVDYGVIPPILTGGNDASGNPSADWGKCLMAAGVRARAEKAETLAFAEDYEDYRADLCTCRYFGCILHEEKK